MAVMNLQDFIGQADKAFFRGDFEFFEKNMTDDASWNIVGRLFASGKPAVLEAMRSVTAEMAVEGSSAQFNRENLIVSGNEAAVKGSIVLTPPSGTEKTFNYFDLYVLDLEQDGKIKELTSFVIESKDEQEGGM